MSNYNELSYNKSNYKPESACIFLIDYLINFPKDLEIFWVGKLGKSYELFNKLSSEINLFKKVHISLELNNKIETRNNNNFSNINFARNACKIFIFDFSDGDGNYINTNNVSGLLLNNNLIDYFKMIVDDEILASQKNNFNPKTFIAINSVNTKFEKIFNDKINCILTPYFNKIRYGVIKDNLELSKLNKLEQKKLELLAQNDLKSLTQNNSETLNTDKEIDFLELINKDLIKQKKKDSIILSKCIDNIAILRNLKLNKSNLFSFNIQDNNLKKNLRKRVYFYKVSNELYLSFKKIIGINNEKKLRKFGKFILRDKLSFLIRKFIRYKILGRKDEIIKSVAFLQTTVFVKNSQLFKTHQTIINGKITNDSFSFNFDSDKPVDILMSYSGNKDLEIKKLKLINK